MKILIKVLWMGLIGCILRTDITGANNMESMPQSNMVEEPRSNQPLDLLAAMEDHEQKYKSGTSVSGIPLYAEYGNRFGFGLAEKEQDAIKVEMGNLSVFKENPAIFDMARNNVFKPSASTGRIVRDRNREISIDFDARSIGYFGAVTINPGTDGSESDDHGVLVLSNITFIHAHLYHFKKMYDEINKCLASIFANQFFHWLLTEQSTTNQEPQQNEDRTFPNSERAEILAEMLTTQASETEVKLNKGSAAEERKRITDNLTKHLIGDLDRLQRLIKGCAKFQRKRRDDLRNTFASKAMSSLAAPAGGRLPLSRMDGLNQKEILNLRPKTRYSQPYSATHQMISNRAPLVSNDDIAEYLRRGQTRRHSSPAPLDGKRTTENEMENIGSIGKPTASVRSSSLHIPAAM